MLAPDGGMHLLVYGRHGRAGIYDMQAALRYALPVDEVLTDVERVQEFSRVPVKPRITPSQRKVSQRCPSPWRLWAGAGTNQSHTYW